MHFEKLRKGIPLELGYPHINRPGSLILVNPLWPHGFFCSWKENERKMKGKWKQWATLRFINTKQGPTDLVDLVDLAGGGLLIRCWHYTYHSVLVCIDFQIWIQPFLTHSADFSSPIQKHHCSSFWIWLLYVHALPSVANVWWSKPSYLSYWIHS